MTQAQGSKQQKAVTDNKGKDLKPTKVVIRRLPPNLTEEDFLEHIAPIPENDYYHFVAPDKRLGQYAFSRAYINFENTDDICIFCEKFDGYVFVDSKGNEYPAVVEYAPFQKCPKKRRRSDLKKNTIEQDIEYNKFLESLENFGIKSTPIEKYIEEIEAKEKELKANHGIAKQSTPLLDYIKRKKDEKRAAKQRAIEERKHREMERRKLKEEERKKRREREKDRVREKAAGPEEIGDAPMKILRKDEGKAGEMTRREEKQINEKTSRGRDGNGHSLITKDRPLKYSRDRDRPRNKDRDRAPKRDRDDKDYRDTRYRTSPTKDKLAKHQSSEGSASYSEHRSKHHDIDGNRSGLQRENRDTIDLDESQDCKVGSDSKTKRVSTVASSGGVKIQHKEIENITPDTFASTSARDAAQAEKSRLRNKDRPERAIYVPGKRAAEKRKEEERRRERKQEEIKKHVKKTD